MSFSCDVKDIILSDISGDKCCRKALILGILTARGKFRKENRLYSEKGIKEIDISLDGDEVMYRTLALIHEVYDKVPQYIRRPRCRSGYTVAFSSSSACGYISSLDERGYIDLSAVCRCKSCKRHFIAGIFLASGKISDPAKCYSLELSVCEGRITSVSDFFAKTSLNFRIGERNGKKYLYMKNGNTIADFFALIEVNDTIFSLLNSKIEKQMRSYANRVANCEANNIAKSVSASSKQIELIEELRDRDMLSSLPDELQMVAKLRIENRELSLSQLSAISTPPISKSGLSHRLSRLTEYAKKLLGYDREITLDSDNAQTEKQL